MGKTALILGASGKIGRYFSTAFSAAGWDVRAFKRGTDMNAAARGVDVIVNGLNPPAYNNWKTHVPRITQDVLAAAKSSGATILFPGNVYVFGDQPGPWDETTPHHAQTRKGRLRIEAEAAYRAAADEGVQTIVLRAGDFMMPEPGDDSLGVLYFRDLAKGRVGAPGDPDAVRAHAWLPDLARVGVMLAEKREQLGAFTDVPFPGHAFSARLLKTLVEEIQGTPLKLSPFPWRLMTLASPFWELARELREMRYLYSHPHELGGAQLTKLLPEFEPTPLRAAITQALNARS